MIASNFSLGMIIASLLLLFYFLSLMYISRSIYRLFRTEHRQQEVHRIPLIRQQVREMGVESDTDRSSPSAVDTDLLRVDIRGYGTMEMLVRIDSTSSLDSEETLCDRDDVPWVV